jgi:hypothetical protein
MVRKPVRVPVALGLNSMPMMHWPPAAKLDLQLLLLILKSPLTEMLAMPSASVAGVQHQYSGTAGSKDPRRYDWRGTGISFISMSAAGATGCWCAGKSGCRTSAPTTAYMRPQTPPWSRW